MHTLTHTHTHARTSTHSHTHTRTQTSNSPLVPLLIRATPRVDCDVISAQLWSTITAIFPCVALSWWNCSLPLIFVYYYHIQKRPTIWIWLMLLRAFVVISHQQFFVPRIGTILVRFIPSLYVHFCVYQYVYTWIRICIYTNIHTIAFKCTWICTYLYIYIHMIAYICSISDCVLSKTPFFLYLFL